MNNANIHLFQSAIALNFFRIPHSEKHPAQRIPTDEGIQVDESDE
jgi:hypothetical protein